MAAMLSRSSVWRAGRVPSSERSEVGRLRLAGVHKEMSSPSRGRQIIGDHEVATVPTEAEGAHVVTGFRLTTDVVALGSHVRDI
jgi:hypothetical protein